MLEETGGITEFEANLRSSEFKKQMAVVRFNQQGLSFATFCTCVLAFGQQDSCKLLSSLVMV